MIILLVGVICRVTESEVGDCTRMLSLDTGLEDEGDGGLEEHEVLRGVRSR